MIKTLKFLELLTAAFPPGPNQHHAIYLDDGMLKITIFRGEIWNEIRLDNPNDLDTAPEDLVESIKVLLS